MQPGAEISPATQAESEPIPLSALHHGVYCLRQAALIHRDRPGRPSLALDLMDELRPIFADRLALSLINRRQLGPADFERGGRGAVWLAETGRKIVLTAWQERKKEERRHDFLGEGD